jgi:hypothetical protein
MPVIDCQGLVVSFLGFDFDNIKSFACDYEQSTTFAETPLDTEVLSLQGNANGYHVEQGVGVGSRPRLEVNIVSHGFEQSLLDNRGASGTLTVAALTPDGADKFRISGTACLLACSYSVSAGDFGTQAFRFVFLEQPF